MFACIQVSKAHSWTCMDIYVFATPYTVSWDYYLLSREHTFEFKEWAGKAEYEYVSCHFLAFTNYLMFKFFFSKENL